ncbi:MAG TPA: sulfotransferase [Longimicrobiales bacterium]|nr:sulfotransferase [Longimicrobiales bacterium]
MLPTFFVIGQAKCGTTSVCEHLRHHPQVFFTEPKEPHYFAVELPGRTWEWYQSLLKGSEQAVAVGEGSTSYTRPDIFRKCAEGILGHVPEARLVYLVRDPIARLESDWKMRVREGRADWDDINTSIDNNPAVVELGKYWRNISAYRELFPEEQLLILSLEDLSRDPEESYRRIYRHIGVDEWFPEADDAASNTAEDYRKGGVLSWARKLGLGDAVRTVLPERMIGPLKALVSTPYRYEANWDPARLADLQALYREASAPLLDHMGKPRDFWSYRARG